MEQAVRINWQKAHHTVPTDRTALKTCLLTCSVRRYAEIRRITATLLTHRLAWFLAGFGF